MYRRRSTPTTLFAVTIPLKIWNNTRNEKKLEEQERLLVEARLAALTSQINPALPVQHAELGFLADPHRPQPGARDGGEALEVLRRLLRKHENFSALRDELSFIEDYLSIEVVRFGDKLRFEKDVAGDTLDMLVPSMLLQPLVENSIKHGLEQQGGGRHHPHSHAAAANRGCICWWRTTASAFPKPSWPPCSNRASASAT